jgi:putative acetyltransferase
VLIRPETPSDIDATKAVHDAAFGQEWQSRGIWSSLMESAIALTVECGVPLLLLLGHADYYPRFGFEPARRLGIEPPQPWPDAAWLALRLPGWTPDLRGVARYAPAFGVG